MKTCLLACLLAEMGTCLFHECINTNNGTEAFVPLHLIFNVVCTQRSQSLEYYWDHFVPLATRMPTNGDYFDNIYHSRPLPSHLEICHSNRCHYDVITMLDSSLATSVPTICTTVHHVDLT